MQAELLDLLCSPGDQRPLRLEGESLIAEASGRLFPIRQGIPCFLDNFSSPWPHRFWRAFYDRAAFAYDSTLRLGNLLRIGSEERIRREIIAALEVPKGARLLEIGCGTGANRPFLRKDATYLGLDISFNMLRRAQARCAAMQLSAHFVQADAIALPVRDHQIDLVIAMGVLQHISQSERALREMARVAKAGARLLIIDELKPIPLLRKIPWAAILTPNGQREFENLDYKIDDSLHLKQIQFQLVREYFILSLEKTPAPA